MGLICSAILWSSVSQADLSTSEYDNAWDMANLSARVYDSLWDVSWDALAPAFFPNMNFEGNTENYVVVQTYTETLDGFDAKLYFNTQNEGYVLAFRGTQIFSPSDWIADIAQALNDYVQVNITQYHKAVELAQELKVQYGSNVQITGHSLGGGLAQVAGMATGLTTTCFEAAGISTATFDDLGITSKTIRKNSNVITHFNVKNDPLSDNDGRMNTKAPYSNTLQYGGETYWLDNVFGTGGRWNPTRVINHFYHTVVYKLSQKDFH